MAVAERPRTLFGTNTGRFHEALANPDCQYVRLKRARERFRKAFLRTDGQPPACGVSALRLSFFLDDQYASAKAALAEHIDGCLDCRERLARPTSGHELFSRFSGFALGPFTFVAHGWDRLLAYLTPVANALGMTAAASNVNAVATVASATPAASTLAPAVGMAIVVGAMAMAPVWDTLPVTPARPETALWRREIPSRQTPNQQDRSERNGRIRTRHSTMTLQDSSLEASDAA